MKNSTSADRQMTTGEPVPADSSHTELRADGQQKGYVVLTPEERAKGFVKPVRRSYTHKPCGGITTMGVALAETYARDPNFYSGTFCCECGKHFPLDQFNWEPDGEPMDTLLQDEWNKEEQRRVQEHRDRNAAQVATQKYTESMNEINEGPRGGGLLARIVALEARVKALEGNRE